MNKLHRTMKAGTVAATLLMSASYGRAKVEPTTLRELSAEADAIGLAKVDKVERVEGVRVAFGTVSRALKGLRAGQRVAFVAQGTWECDGSDAKWGETVLLFLNRLPERGLLIDGFYHDFPRHLAMRDEHPSIVPVYQIAHAGFGRMPIRDGGGKEWVRPGMDLGTDGLFSFRRKASGWMTVPDAEDLVGRFLRARMAKR